MEYRLQATSHVENLISQFHKQVLPLVLPMNWNDTQLKHMSQIS